jgi:hypothetical protein
MRVKSFDVTDNEYLSSASLEVLCSQSWW